MNNGEKKNPRYHYTAGFSSNKFFTKIAPRLIAGVFSRNAELFRLDNSPPQIGVNPPGVKPQG
ncbi:MAG: hypothetical protein LBK73_15820 [Treponema sp.]|jgi:hypothetical protein|nr:hypothetical protein [Treponema sp.]